MALKSRKAHMGLRLFKTTILFISLLSSLMAGEIDRLINWKPHPKHPGMILPVLKGESPLQAINKYREGIYKTPDLSEAMKRHNVTKQMIGGNTWEPVSIDAIKESPRAHILHMANKFNDYQPKYYRIWDFINPVVRNGGVPYFLPISYDISLTKNQASEFRNLISTTFDALFGMGGEDVNPAEYGESITHSNATEVVPTRDASEIKMIKTYIHKKRGVYYGICRGSQICYVAKGGKLKQDIFVEGMKDPHIDVWHNIKIVKQDDNLLRAFVGRDEISIYSYHHQAVREGTADVMVNSTAGEGQNFVVEGYQFKNGLGLTFQFHPEMMHNEDGDRMMDGLINYASFVKEQRKLGPNCINLVQKFLGF